MSLLGYAIGGALEGYGKSVMNDAIAMREAAFKEAEAQRNHARDMERVTTVAGLNEQAAEKDRSFREKEGQLNREAQGRQLVNDDTGGLFSVSGDKASPVKDPEGKQVSGIVRGSGGNRTDFDKKLEIARKVFDGDEKKALDYATGRKATTPEQRERLAQGLAESLSRDDFSGRVDPEKFRENLEKARKEMEDLFGEEAETATAKGQPEQPTGSGSEDDPFVAQTQAHVDWINANQPAGVWVIANGKKLKKK